MKNKTLTTIEKILENRLDKAYPNSNRGDVFRKDIMFATVLRMRASKNEHVSILLEALDSMSEELENILEDYIY